MKKLYKILSLGLMIIGALGIFACLPAHAVNSVVDPTSQTVYVADNTNALIRIYTYSTGMWFEVTPFALPAGSACYGLAVFNNGPTPYNTLPNTGMLLITVTNGTSSHMIYTPLNAQGLPIGTAKDIYPSTPTSSLTGVTIAGGNRAYLLDAANKRVLFFDYNGTGDTWLQAPKYIITPEKGYDITTTKVQYFNEGATSKLRYKIIISNKGSAGKILIYDYVRTIYPIGPEGPETTTPLTGISGISYPTQLKVNYQGTNLYIAVNGASGGDVTIYDISGATPSLKTTISNPDGWNGMYGWTGIALSADENHLFFSQAKDASQSETKVYRVKVANYAIEQIQAMSSPNKVDGLNLSNDYSSLAAAYSYNGRLNPEGSTISTGTNNQKPARPSSSSLKQYRTNGTEWTEFPSEGSTNSNEVQADFIVQDNDGGVLIPKVYFRTMGEGAYTSVTGSPTASGNTILPKISMLVAGDGNYEWYATATDLCGAESEYSAASYFTVDNVRPGPIVNLEAYPGDPSAPAAGKIRLLWNEVGDNGTTGGNVASYVAKYSYAGAITADTFDSATTISQAWIPASPGDKHPTEVVTNLEPGRQIWVAIKAVDKAGNIGGFGNCATTYVSDDSNAVPTVTNAYPKRVLAGNRTEIMIEGTNFTNPFLAYLYSTLTPLTPLEELTYISSTRAKATVPATFATGNYYVVIATPGGISNNNNNAKITVTSEANLQAPATVSNFTATGASGKINLSWTNPSESDLYEMIVVRSDTGWPAIDASGNPTTGTTVLSIKPAKPSSSETYEDTGVNAGTTYYYAVFSRNTSNTWNTTVDYTLPNVNAASATPGGGGDISITSLTITRDADAVGSSVTVRWTTNPAGLLADIWTKTGTFSITASEWTRSSQNATLSYTDASQVGNGTTKYYKVIPAGTTLTNSSLTSEVVGKFDIAVSNSDIARVFFSLPLSPESTSMSRIIGGQAKNGDVIATIDTEYNVVDAAMSDGAGGWSAIEAPFLSNLNMGYGYAYIATESKNLSFVGKVNDIPQNTHLISGDAQANFIGSYYPVQTLVSADATGLNVMDNGTVFALVKNDINLAEMDLHGNGNVWTNYVNEPPAPVGVMEPGRAYYLLLPNGTANKNWTQSKPY